MSKGTHKTKDGRTAVKGLYYNMNKRKKSGTSRPGKGTVTDAALKRSAKTAKKKKGGFPDMNNDKKITQADIFLKKKENGTIPQDAKKGGLRMVKDPKTGKMVPFYAADNKGKMGMGGKKKMMKKGGKKKMGYGGKMKYPGGGMMKKKMMYETGGFLEPGIPNLDDCCN